jgi:hypothetical protein
MNHADNSSTRKLPMLFAAVELRTGLSGIGSAATNDVWCMAQFAKVISHRAVHRRSESACPLRFACDSSRRNTTAGLH